MGGAAGVAALVWAAVSLVASGPSDQTSPVASTPDFVWSPTFISASAVGVIRWERVDGDRASLPARIVGMRGNVLVGLDDDRTSSSASADGRRWSSTPEAGAADVGGVVWRVAPSGERRVLTRISEGGELPAAVADPLDAPRDGFTTHYEVPDDAADGLPVQIGGEIFARLDRRTEIPWSDVFGVARDAALSVHVQVGDEVLTFGSSASGSTVDVGVAVVSDESTDRATIVDGSGMVIWEFDTGGLDPIDALRPSKRLSWLSWDGTRFVEIDVPWATADRVEVFAVGDGALAVPTIETGAPANGVWWTSNGTDWQSVALPTERSAGSPMPVHAGSGAVILTISAGDRTSSWSTIDGATFQELPNVPGVGRSSTGTFGAVAPDPRSNPIVRVSADGEHWEQVDVSEQLDVAVAQWGLTIDATAVGSKIYVIATRGDTRTLLIGTVTTDS